MHIGKFVTHPCDKQETETGKLLLKIDKMAVGLMCPSSHLWDSIQAGFFDGIEHMGTLTEPPREGWLNRNTKGDFSLKRSFKRRRTHRFGQTLIEIYFGRTNSSKYDAVVRITNHDFFNGDQQHVLMCLQLHRLLGQLGIPYRLSPLGERCEVTLDSPNLALHEWMDRKMWVKWTTKHKSKYWSLQEGRMVNGHHSAGQTGYLTNDTWRSSRIFSTYVDERIPGKYRTLEMRTDSDFLRNHGIATIEEFVTRIPDVFLSYVQLLEMDIKKLFSAQEKFKKQGRFSEFYRSSKRQWEQMAAESTNREIIERLLELLPGMSRGQIARKFFRRIELPQVAAAFNIDNKNLQNSFVINHFSHQDHWKDIQVPSCIFPEMYSVEQGHPSLINP